MAENVLDTSNITATNQKSTAVADQLCPLCGLNVSEITQRCDCGYDFAEQVMRNTDVSPLAAGGFSIATGEQRMLVYCVDIIVASIFAGLIGGFSGFTLLGVIAMVAYYFFCEAVTNRTFGKMLAGTCVVSLQGGTPSLRSLLLRSLVRLMPVEPLSGLGKKHTWWHDRWSHTRVVRTISPVNWDA